MSRVDRVDMGIVIPARNEEWLARTVEDIQKNIRGKTKVFVICDGAWPDPPVQDNEVVNLVFHPKSIGQRAATNEGARLAGVYGAKFVMKCDAHCAFDEGFDVKLMADCEHDWTVIPRMFNLHVFDWQCGKCGNKTYQGPRPAGCPACDNTVDFERVIVWRPRKRRMTDFARFDTDLHFQYWRAYGKRPEAQGDIADVMCCVGACWAMHLERYWELGGMDEQHGSWGQMGVELACKTWLSGGRQVVNKKTWFAHLFRTQPGFGFPYPNPGSQIARAREHSRRLWVGGEWPGAKKTLDDLLERFYPVPGWHEKKAIVYYTDNRLDERIAQAVRRQLKVVADAAGVEIISVSLKPIKDFGRNIVIKAKRGYLTMFRQILAGLEATKADIVFFAEHDVLYHASHFDFVPDRADVFFYNENVWKVDSETGRALFYNVQQTSGLCAYRRLLLEHYRERVRRVEAEGFSRRMGFEPGTHNRAERVDDYGASSWMSEEPNIDIRHRQNLTKTRWSKDEFRNKRFTKGWKEAEEVPPWYVAGRFSEILDPIG